MRDELRPTLWRSARVLANPRRLAVLRTVSRGGAWSVTKVAECCGISLSHATQILRSLQARGLLQAQRRGQWVFYVPEVNPEIPQARPLADALRKVWVGKGWSVKKIVADLTAYTHPRRVAIVQAVAHGRTTASEVREACRLSRPALSRHLDKLVRRRVLESGKRGLSLCQPASPLASALLVLALAE